MSSKNDALFWKKKEYISFLLSILVLFIHTHFADTIISDCLISVVNNKVSYFFSDSITRFAVPMFFVLSGISFFKDYNNKKYLSKIKSRLFTLVIPYLLWNTIWMLWEEGQTVGIKVTLRGERMYNFYDKFVSIALPRLRDFRGVPDKAFDGRGNYSVGLKEQLIFPEITYDQVEKIRGMDVAIVTTAKTDEEARELLRALGMPFKK